MSSKTIDEQLAIINNVMSKPSQIEYRFRFGKYKGRSLDYVFKTDPEYLLWCYHNDISLPDRVIKFIEDQVLKGYQ